MGKMLTTVDGQDCYKLRVLDWVGWSWRKEMAVVVPVDEAQTRGWGASFGDLRSVFSMAYNLFSSVPAKAKSTSHNIYWTSGHYL